MADPKTDNKNDADNKAKIETPKGDTSGNSAPSPTPPVQPVVTTPPAAVPSVAPGTNPKVEKGPEPEIEYDPGYSQQTIDEMKAGADAIARRNRPGRRKDILDAAEANSNAAKDNANRVVK